MSKDLINFILTATDNQYSSFIDKANSLAGEVNIPENYKVKVVAEALKHRFNLKTLQIVFAKKLSYAYKEFTEMKHYTDNNSVIDDIKSGHFRRQLNSYRKLEVLND